MAPRYGTEAYFSQIAEVKSLRSYFRSLPRLREIGEKCNTIEWSPDGKFLAASLLYEKAVCLFTLAGDRDKLVKECTMRGHQGTIDQMCWHKISGDLLATCGSDKTVRVWDARSQKCQACVQTKGENIYMAWSPDGTTIAVGNKNDMVSFIDTRKFDVFREEQFNTEVNEFTWDPENARFFVTTASGHFRVLSYPSLELIDSILAHPTNCIALKFTPDGTKFAIGSTDSNVTLWDSKELTCIKTFSRLEWPIRSVGFSHDGKLLASASEDHIVDIAHVESGEKVAELPGAMPSLTVAWHPQRYILAHCTDACNRKDVGTLRVWGLSS